MKSSPGKTSLAGRREMSSERVPLEPDSDVQPDEARLVFAVFDVAEETLCTCGADARQQASDQMAGNACNAERNSHAPC